VYCLWSTRRNELHSRRVHIIICSLSLLRSSAQREFDLKSQLWFQTKLHSIQFNCHFIRSILKSHNFIALNFRFLVYCSSSRFVKKSGTGNVFTSHLVCKTMSCDENSFEHDKEASNSEVRAKIVYFSYKSSILVAWINYGRPSFLLWLRLRVFIVFGEEIWRCTSCVILRSISFEFFFFKYRSMAWFYGSPAPYHLRFFLWPRRRTQYSGPCQVLAAPFVWRYFQDGGTGTDFVRRSFIHCLVQCGVFWPCLFTATELSSFVASFKTTRNLEIFTFLRWLWICCCVVFVCLCFTGLGLIRILSRCWRKIAKILVKMDTESWKLPLK